MPEIPVEGGMLDLTPPLARCCSCGWEGVPTYMVRALTECPKCEGAREGEDELWRSLLEWTGRRGWLFKIRRRRFARKKVARNAPCPCGSGVKFKKCHGR